MSIGVLQVPADKRGSETRPLAVGQVDESNPQAVRRFLQPLVQHLGVSVLVTADLASLRTVAGKLGLEQQVCPCHLRRRVHHRLPP